jgi:hypothetical protein
VNGAVPEFASVVDEVVVPVAATAGNLFPAHVKAEVLGMVPLGTEVQFVVPPLVAVIRDVPEPIVFVASLTEAVKPDVAVDVTIHTPAKKAATTTAAPVTTFLRVSMIRTFRVR